MKKKDQLLHEACVANVTRGSGQQRHYGGAVPVHERQSVRRNIAYREDVEHNVGHKVVEAY